MSKMMNVIDEITSEMISEQQKTYSLDDGSIKEVYRDSSGKIVAVIHELFPGVHLVFKEIERTSFLANYKKSRCTLIVEHCWRGEMNSSDDKSTMYSSQGDIIIHSIDNQECSIIRRVISNRLPFHLILIILQMNLKPISILWG